MFNPTPKQKKLLASARCVYLHNDGVCIWEEKQIKIDADNSAKIDVWHLIPCDLEIRATDYSKEYSWKDRPMIHRIVIHEGSLVANGVDHVKVSFNNSSLATREKGITINVVNFQKGSHKWECIDIVGLYGGNVSIQPDVTNKYSFGNDADKSIRSYLEYQYKSGNSVVIHGELPEVKIPVLQLTVNN